MISLPKSGALHGSAQSVDRSGQGEAKASSPNIMLQNTSRLPTLTLRIPDEEQVINAINLTDAMKEQQHHLQTLSNKERIPFFPLNFRAPARQVPVLRMITGP
jgi:hypothetical protein